MARALSDSYSHIGGHDYMVCAEAFPCDLLLSEWGDC